MKSREELETELSTFAKRSVEIAGLFFYSEKLVITFSEDFYTEGEYNTIFQAIPLDKFESGDYDESDIIETDSIDELKEKA